MPLRGRPRQQLLHAADAAAEKTKAADTADATAEKTKAAAAADATAEKTKAAAEAKIACGVAGLAGDDGVEHTAVFAEARVKLLERAKELKDLTDAAKVGLANNMEAVTAVEEAENMRFDATKEKHKRARWGHDEYKSLDQQLLSNQLDHQLGCNG
jgi:hypothetical protein